MKFSSRLLVLLLLLLLTDISRRVFLSQECAIPKVSKINNSTEEEHNSSNRPVSSLIKIQHSRMSPLNRLLEIPNGVLNNSCIAVFGDSISMAYDVRDKKKKNYSDKLKIKLLNTNNIKVDIIKHSRPGLALQDWMMSDMSKTIINTATTCKQRNNITAIIIQLGVNDALRASTVSHFISWYSLLVSQIKQYYNKTTTIVLCGLSMINPSTSDGWIVEANTAISEIAAANNGLYVDLFSYQVEGSKKGKVLDDEVHPSPFGIDLITDSLHAALVNPDNNYCHVLLKCGGPIRWSGFIFSPTWSDSFDCRSTPPISVRVLNGSEIRITGLHQPMKITPPWQNSFMKMPIMGSYSLLIDGTVKSTYEVTPHTKQIIWEIPAGVKSVSTSLIKAKKY